jgi:hypothetical protein
MSTNRKRWPKEADNYRLLTLEAADQILATADEADREVKRNPMLARMQIAEIRTQAALIRSWMIEAKIGK